MKNIRLLSLTGLASGIYLAAALGSASAAPVPAASAGDLLKAGSATSMIEEVQFRGRRVVRGGGRHVGGRRFGRGAVGAGIAAGVIGGLIGGALLAPGPSYAAPAPVYEEPVPYYQQRPVYAAPAGGGSVEWCMRRYRSYDPRTGTYVGMDGRERSCP